MASQNRAPDYLPPLNDCFSGEAIILSWVEAFLALCDLDILSRKYRRSADKAAAQVKYPSGIEHFLTQGPSREILRRNLYPFQKCSPDTKKAFDATTAPINVTPSDTSKTLIEDSLWLSKQTGIDESASLRVALIEYQDRSRIQLASGLTEEEAVGIQEAWKNSSLRGPSFSMSTSVLGIPTKTERQTFLSTERRKRRLLEIYMAEKNAILAVGKLLLQHALSDGLDCLPWVSSLSKDIADSQGLEIPPTQDGPVRINGTVTKFIPTGIAALRAAVSNAAICPWEMVSDEGDFIVLWGSQQMTEMIQILQYLFIHVSASTVPQEAQDVASWYSYMAESEFFARYEPPASQQSISHFQLLISSISLSILSTQATIVNAEDYAAALVESADNRNIAKHLYFSDIECLHIIHEALSKASGSGPSPATPAILAWSLISRALLFQKENIESTTSLGIDDSPEERRQSTSIPTVFDEFSNFMNQHRSDDDPHPTMLIAMSSIQDGRVFQLIVGFMSLLASACGSHNELVIESHIRKVFLELIGEAVGIVQYSQEIVLATLAILNAAFTHDSDSVALATINAVQYLQKNDLLREEILGKALLRFPFEIIPALKLGRAAMLVRKDDESPESFTELRNMKAFTLSVPTRQYQVLFQTREDEHGNPRARLDDELRLFAPLTSSKTSWRSRREGSPADTLLIVPAGSEGYLSQGEGAHVVSLEYEYSAIDYLAKLLSTATANADSVATMSESAPDLEVICESVAFFTSILSTQAKTESAEGSALKILEQAQVTIDSDGDLISVVLDIFEKNLRSDKLRTDSDLTVELYSNCVAFLDVLLLIQPSRVWSFLARTQFLELHRSNVNLASIILAVETVLGQYDLLLSCIRLTSSLVENAISTTIKPAVSTKALSRFGSVRSRAAPSPAKSQSSVIATFLKVFTGALESLPNWRFNDPTDQLKINTSLMLLFDKILTYTYGFDDPTKEKGHVGEVMFPSAKYLLDIYLSVSSNEMAVLPTLNLLATGLKMSPSPVHMQTYELVVTQTKATLSFSTTLLRVGTLMNHPTSRFEQLLFRSAPIIIRLFARLGSCQSNVLKLLTAMIESGGRMSDDPPSLLGHLGTDTAKCFLQLISSYPRRLHQDNTGVSLWTFLTTIITARQQWLTVYLLTGKSPRESFKSTTTASSAEQTKPVLQVALEKVKNLSNIPEQEALAVLRFLSAVQSYVPWALVKHETEYRTSKDSMVSTLSNMQWDSKSSKQEEKAYQLSIAAIITEILAMEIHDARNRGAKVDTRSLYPHLHLLRNNGVEPPAFNNSLHASLQKNLETKFPGSKLERFKHTSVTATYLGTNYCYDLDLATKLLGGDQAWKQNSEDGYWHEFCRANINLSFVESQIMLLNSWKLLTIELSHAISDDDQWTQALVQTARDCLKANAESQLPEALFERLSSVRVDFAFALIQKLVNMKCGDPSALELVKTVWDTMTASVPDFNNVFASPTAEYYRSLLRVLFLTLQFHVWSPGDRGNTKGPKQKASELRMTIDVTPILLEILNTVIATGFRCLANMLHEDSSLCSPTDFVLLTAILQKLLLVPSIRTIQHDIASDIAKSETSRYATTLFSWSDRLSANDGDPLYGELSILFLLELSIITPVAEHLAIEGVLSQLNDAAIMEYLRRPNGTGPFDHPPRMFSIWTRGILPLCLNLLHAVGPPIAAEVATFLNQFPGQLERAGTSLSGRIAPSVSNPNVGRITLGMASEAHSLSLISLLLDQYRLRGTSEGIVAGEVPSLDWDRMGVKEDIDGWLQGKRGLRDRIVPANEKELEFLGVRASDAASESKLEERIIAEFAGALECLNMNIQN
ncbi:hypothetical protein EJ05DRAFT_463776 [Pseudovirgaria hyperparasitica]|uniref:Uncharacterized protein n=1 Tax=Pseudovirgaria hyperparasitica TaxID=470096 RepID=A0A6A6WDG9_9PEZI|nr:uncharacterized protein EJ05DRAFT_463776 [Pseudovirgaria hyperparasitica]KAF2759151.1 hypothetical protein EJ05DRAFT_463776 [Pseudovirgaria hyperparasitica]